MFITLGSKPLIEQLCGSATDALVGLLLRGMDLAFCLSRAYRRNIKNFEGRYLFTTTDGSVVESATFTDSNMHVQHDGIRDWDVKVTFKDAPALKAFLFSQDQDILDSVLRNDVEVEGNLNYIYKFGFMARDLMRRLGVGYDAKKKLAAYR
jgi:hypothetical protein